MDWKTYADRWALLFEGTGLPGTAGRIWGWFLVSRPPEQSLAELCGVLGISKGAASTNTRLLEAHGLLERVAVPGSREVYYRVPSDAYEALMEKKLRATREWQRLAAEGIGLAAEIEAEAPERLRQLHRFYSFMEREQERIMERWRQGADEEDAPGQ